MISIRACLIIVKLFISIIYNTIYFLLANLDKFKLNKKYKIKPATITKPKSCLAHHTIVEQIKTIDHFSIYKIMHQLILRVHYIWCTLNFDLIRLFYFSNDV